ncbi:DUF4411 family protein [Qipengyuania flava]|uniref:DUF4411 family protein n=1 Tax=Qipengyuania flava TaxID=192812 RepID=UPI00321ADBCA
MKRYCVDMSGLSNPASEDVAPQDIHVSLWMRVHSLIENGDIAVTEEIYEELTHIPAPLGDCIKENKKSLLLEVDDDAWDAATYIEHATRMQDEHQKYIREFNGGGKGTVGLNDISIVALGKTLKLPVVSMEKRKALQSDRKRAIPDICDAENVTHMTFNEFLRAEGITL